MLTKFYTFPTKEAFAVGAFALLRVISICFGVGTGPAQFALLQVIILCIGIPSFEDTTSFI